MLHGIIKSIDGLKVELTSDGGPVAFTLDQPCTVELDGAKVKLSHLSNGLRVSAHGPPKVNCHTLRAYTK